MDAELQAIQNILATIPELRYIDEDWGQLDAYSPNPPTQFPLALIDIGTFTYENLGIDKTATPKNRQTGLGTVVLSIADIKLSNTSFRAPQTQKDNAWQIHKIIQKIHEKLHGIKVTEITGALIRVRMQKIRRDDGIQEYELTYTFGVTNV